VLIVQITLVLFEERREGKMRRRLSVLTLGFLCLLVLAMSLLEAYAGVFIIPYIEVPGVDLDAIKRETVGLNNTIPATVAPADEDVIGDYDGDGAPDLMVRFDRAAVVAWLGETDYGVDTGKHYEVTFRIAGWIFIDELAFIGFDTVQVITKK